MGAAENMEKLHRLMKLTNAIQNQFIVDLVSSSQYLLKLYKKYKFPLTVLRLYQAYGERQDINRLIPIVITSYIKDEEFPCSDGKQFRDFVYISDVVQAIIKSIHSEKSKGQVFNLGSSKPIKIKKINFNFEKKIGKGKPIFLEK